MNCRSLHAPRRRRLAGTGLAPVPVLLLLLGTLPAALGAQGVVTGEVRTAEGAPLAARVAVPALDRSLATDDSGRFALRGLPAGEHLFVVTRLGWAPARRLVRVGPGPDTVRVLVRLERSVVTLAGVQVTATPTGRDPLAVAQATSTIEAGELDRRGAATLGAALARQPGVTERWQGPAASAPVIRGLSGDRLVVLQDGQRTGDLASTAPDHGVTIDPATASRVEIVRGPAALLYGNNAIGGVVNVVSDDLPTTRPARATGGVVATLESATAGGSTTVDVAAPFGAALAVRARAGWREHDDVRLGAGAATPRLANTQARARHASLGVGAAGERGSAAVAWRGYGFAYGLPSRDGAAGEVRLRGGRHEALGRAEWRARGGRGAVERVRLDANAQWYAHDELTAGGVLGTALALRSQWVQLLARTRDAGPLRDGAIGAAALLRRNGVGGPQALTPPNASHTVGVFAFQEVALLAAPWLRDGRDADGAPLVRQLRLPVGVRVDRFVLASDATGRFGAARRRELAGMSGSVGVTAPLATGASLGANVARAVRSPTAEELFSQAGHAGTGAFEIGDPTLGVETTVGTDVVLRVARPRLAAQLAAYGTRIAGYVGLLRARDVAGAPRDTTVARPDGGTATYPLYRVQQRDVRSRGVEGMIEGALLPRVVAGAMGDLVRLTDAAGSPVPFVPAARLGGSARWDDGRRSLGATARHVFAQRRVPAGEHAAAAYTLVELHASVAFADGAHALTLRVDNATDAVFRDASSRVKDFAPGPGRNVVATWRASW